MAWDATDLGAFNDPDMPGYAVATIGAADVSGRFLKNYASILDIGGSNPVFRCAASAGRST